MKGNKRILKPMFKADNSDSTYFLLCERRAVVVWGKLGESGNLFLIFGFWDEMKATTNMICAFPFENPLCRLDALGALDYKKLVHGQPWRLFTCMWLHGGLIHLLANVLSLLFIGVRLEQEFGFVKIGTLYVISGIGGSLMSSLSIQTKISIGASGALFGLLGAMLSELIINWSIYANKCTALLTLLVVIVLNMAVGMVPQVDSSAHIGGFISGFLLGFILLMRPQFGWIGRKHIPPGYDMKLIKTKHKAYQYVLWIVAFVMLVVWFMDGLIRLFGDRFDR